MQVGIKIGKDKSKISTITPLHNHNDAKGWARLANRLRNLLGRGQKVHARVPI
ncbi:MAG: hypothetical protein OJF62_002768 [Pseudolabrys sp.]|nr:hypothetical protein [Pseudolabrys sp.]